MLTLTKHSKERAKERGIPFSVLTKVSNLDEKYSYKGFANGENCVKRIFSDINLQFALHDGHINKFEFHKLKNLCLVVNNKYNQIITLYPLDPMQHSNQIYI